MRRVELHMDPTADASFPRQRAATVEIETADGNTYRHYSPTRKGDPDNPLTDAELIDKFRELVDPVVGDGASRRLLDTLWALDTLDDTAKLEVVGSN